MEDGCSVVVVIVVDGCCGDCGGWMFGGFGDCCGWIFGVLVFLIFLILGILGLFSRFLTDFKTFLPKILIFAQAPINFFVFNIINFFLEITVVSFIKAAL